MKSLSALVAVVALAAKASAHYVFPDLIVGGVNSSDWQINRQTNNWQDLNPVTDVTTTDIRCFSSLESGTAPTTKTVNAGDTVSFSIFGNPSNLYHDGVVNVYMAQAPASTPVANWDGSGQVWFKIFQIPAVTDGGTSITFPATGLTEITVTIPKQVPTGQYLMRAEHIALHVAEVFQGAQFYIACAQLNVVNGGTGTPGPLVSFPGAYTGMEPGILINIYWPIPTTYVQPGPAVWPAVGGSSPTSAPATTAPSSPTSAPATTAPPTTVKSTAPPTTTAKSPTTTVSSPASTATGTVAEWAQCGGQGYTGPTACVSPFVCSQLNPFFFQCVPANQAN